MTDSSTDQTAEPTAVLEDGREAALRHARRAVAVRLHRPNQHQSVEGFFRVTNRPVDINACATRGQFIA